jgi:hypothetical protein
MRATMFPGPPGASGIKSLQPNFKLCLSIVMNFLRRWRALIEKHTGIGQSTDKKFPNRSAKRQAELKNNLKKVKWSMKEGEATERACCSH